MLSAGRPPGRRRPCWGDGTSGGGWALSTDLRAPAGCPDRERSPLGFPAMHDALLVAETALLEERRPLTRDEALAVAALPLDELPDLIALAHQVRLAYCGAEVELESLINAKSGACPEDCAFCSQSVRYSTDVDVYPFLAARRGARSRARHARRGRHAVLHRGRRPRAVGAACSRKVIDAVDAVQRETGLEVACSLGLLTPEQARTPRGRGRASATTTTSKRRVRCSRRSAPRTPTTTASTPRSSPSTPAWSCAAAASSAWARRSSSASTSRSSSPSSSRARCRSTSSRPPARRSATSA